MTLSGSRTLTVCKAVQVAGLLVCALIAACSRNPVQLVVVDKSDCVNFNVRGDPCSEWKPYGTFNISVNGPANTCAVAFEAPDRPGPTYSKIDGVSYIGPDDWECRSIVNTGSAIQELMVARMSHGKLTMEYLYDNGHVVPIKFTVRSRTS